VHTFVTVPDGYTSGDEHGFITLTIPFTKDDLLPFDPLIIQSFFSYSTDACLLEVYALVCYWVESLENEINEHSFSF